MAWGLYDIGHQGLIHDEFEQMIHNRARTLHPQLQRFCQRDPLGYDQPGGGYQDGMSLYQYLKSMPLVLTDSSGSYAGITVHPAQVKMKIHTDRPVKEMLDINVGHEWIEISRSFSFGFVSGNYTVSLGFWPSGCILQSDGEIHMPDEYQGDRDGTTDWETEKVDYRTVGFWSEDRQMAHPTRKTAAKWRGGGYLVKEDVGCCKDKNEGDVTECIAKWAAYYDQYVEFTLDISTCREFVVDALGNCCLNKK